VEESKLEDTLPPSVCDAARQTIGLTDKRTTIEVLVTQDKLACSGSTPNGFPVNNNMLMASPNKALPNC